MKKKFLSFILAVCLIIPCAFVFSACANDDDIVLSNGAFTVKGKTFEVTDEVRILWDNGLSDTAKASFLQVENEGVEISEADFVAKVKAVAAEMVKAKTTFEFTKNYDDAKHGYKLIVKNADKTAYTGTYYQPDDCSYVGYDVGKEIFSEDSATIIYVGDGEYALTYGGYRPGNNPSPDMMNTNVVIILKQKP